MNNLQNAGYGQAIFTSEFSQNNNISEPQQMNPFPISDFGDEEFSIEEFEKLNGTSFIDFLRSQDDML